MKEKKFWNISNYKLICFGGGILEKELSFIYNKILDTYTNSKKFKEDKNGNIFIKLVSEEIYLESLNRFEINKKLKYLKQQGKLDIIWYETNNIIEKIKVSSENIDYFYNVLGKEKTKDIISGYTEKIIKMMENFEDEWIKKYFTEDILRKLKKREIPKNIEKIDLIYKALFGIEEMKKNSLDDMLIRVFSKKYFKNSKKFSEQIESNIISILKKYHPLVDKEMDDDSVLQQVGINKTSNDLYIKGDMKIELDGEIIDISKFKYGVGLNKDMVKSINIDSVGNVKRVISIENKANFLSEAYNAHNIIIFSHGYFAPYERIFLLKLKEYLNKDVQYYHSGDLDLGGLSIYKHIKTHIFPQLKPMNMDKEIYLRFLEYGEEKHDKSYLKKLNKIQLEEFKELIEVIQRKEIIIEQESFLIDN